MSEDYWKARNANLNLFCHPFGINMSITNNGELDSDVPETNLKDICTILYRSPVGVVENLASELSFRLHVAGDDVVFSIHEIIRKYNNMTDDEAHMATYPTDIKVNNIEDKKDELLA